MCGQILAIAIVERELFYFKANKYISGNAKERILFGLFFLNTNCKYNAKLSTF